MAYLLPFALSSFVLRHQPTTSLGENRSFPEYSLNTPAPYFLSTMSYSFILVLILSFISLVYSLYHLFRLILFSHVHGLVNFLFVTPASFPSWWIISSYDLYFSIARSSLAEITFSMGTCELLLVEESLRGIYFFFFFF